MAETATQKKKTVWEKLLYVQQNNEVKNKQYDEYNKRVYKNLDDILHGLEKPLADAGLALTLSDELVFNNGLFIKATATVHDIDSGETISADGFSMFYEQKGNNLSQDLAKTSTYARKIACNGLFALVNDKEDDEIAKQQQTIPPQAHFTPTAPLPFPGNAPFPSA